MPFIKPCLYSRRSALSGEFGAYPAASNETVVVTAADGLQVEQADFEIAAHHRNNGSARTQLKREPTRHIMSVSSVKLSATHTVYFLMRKLKGAV